MGERTPMSDDQETFDTCCIEAGPQRTRITHWADLFDLDDFLSCLSNA